MNNNTMFSSNVPKKRIRFGPWGWLLLILVAFCGYTLVRFLVDRDLINSGHEAYLSADCETAINKFEAAVNSWHVIQPGDIYASANKELSECYPYQRVVTDQQNGDYSSALKGYLFFLEDYPDSNLVIASRNKIASLFETIDAAALTSQETCQYVEILSNFINNPDVELPPFYIECGKFYFDNGDNEEAYNFWFSLIEKYPDDPISFDAADLLFTIPDVSCANADALSQNPAFNEFGFTPYLYNTCGSLRFNVSDYDTAIQWFEKFLEDYPNHSLAKEVEASLAQAIIDRTAISGAGIIEPPNPSGNVSGNISEVTINNGSPYKMRIVFKGPETRVEEIPACSFCTKYTKEPINVPQNVPYGTYRLSPGKYDVVVESISEKVTPWEGTWTLISGTEYEEYFYIVQTTIP